MRFGLLILFCGLVLLQTAPPPALAEGGRVVRLTNGEWPPYTSEKLPHYGFFSHVVAMAYRSQDLTVEYSFLPWKRAYRTAELGRYDGSISWAPTPERREAFLFSNPVIESRKVFFHLRENRFTWSGIDDLGRYQIGATAGYTYGMDFDKAWKSGAIPVQDVTEDAQNVRKLVMGRIDAFPMEFAVGRSLISSILPIHQAQRIIHHPKAVMTTPFSVIISRNIDKDRANRLVEALNAGLKQMHEDGSYRRLQIDMLALPDS